MLTPEEKQKVIEKVKLHKKDTGSPEAQIGILTEEMNRLADHLKKFPKDFAAKKGLLKMVSRRRTLLSYLKNSGDESRFNQINKKIGLDK